VVPENNSASQVDVCYSQLRDLIVRCEIPPGTRLTERELMAQLCFGRTPVREALLRLDQDRLVDTKPRSGYRVRPLTRKSIDDFFIAWRAVAPLMAALAFERLTPEQRIHLSSLHDIQSMTPIDDIDANTKIASLMFDILAHAANSEPLRYIYNRFGPEMDRIFRIFFATKAGQTWISGQSRMQEFSRVNDPAEAAERVRHALKLAHRNLLLQIDEKCINGSSHFAIGSAGGITITCEPN